MKFLKTSEWIRIRGQMGPNNEICKIDTAVSDKERVFYIPETDDEKSFFNLDMLIGFTGIPYGPTSHSPDEWGWRLFAHRTEQDMVEFSERINELMKQAIGSFGIDVEKPVLN